jgi:hypothetical protein
VDAFEVVTEEQASAEWVGSAWYMGQVPELVSQESPVEPAATAGLPGPAARMPSVANSRAAPAAMPVVLLRRCGLTFAMSPPKRDKSELIKLFELLSVCQFVRASQGASSPIHAISR